MQSAETLANLQKFLTLLDPSLNLNEMLTNVARQLVDMFNVDHSGMLLFGEEDDTGEVIAEYPSQGVVGLRVPLIRYPLTDKLKFDQKPVAVLHAQTDPQMGSAREVMRSLGIHSILIMPLVVRGKIVGSLSLDAMGRPRQFSEEELALCQVIGNQIAVAVDYTFSLQAVENSHRRAETLRQVNRALSQSLDLDEVLPLILEQLEQVLPVSGSSIFLRMDQGIQLRAWRGRRKPLATNEIIPLERLWGASEIFIHQKAILIPNTREHPRWTIGKDDAIECWLGVPLVVRGEVVGVLNVDGYTPYQFGEADIPLATDFATQAAIAIHNAELYGQVASRAELLHSIQEIGVGIMASLDLDEVLSTVSTSMLELLSADHIRLYLYDALTDQLTLASALNRGGQLARPVAAPLPPRPAGLTATVAHTGRPLAVPDTHFHPLYRDQQLFNYFRAIIGVPLKRREEVIGVVTASYKTPHRFSDDDLDGLQLLAIQVAVALENARLYDVEVKQIEQELSIARQIQRGFLPQVIPQIAGWDIAATCRPARETGGDFYEFVRRRDEHVGLAVGDVSGKGIQAAMLMGAAQSVVAAKGSDHLSPAVVISETNRLLYEDVPAGSFVAVSYALVSSRNSTVWLSNGGQLAPYLLPADDRPLQLIEPPGAHLPLGVLEEIAYREVSLALRPGDTLVFFTDGLAERKNTRRRMFGFEGIAAVLNTVRGQPVANIMQALLQTADAFAGGLPAHDDVTLLLLQRI